ncbi:hypothetical protein PQX77_017450 [Marasmius sp. AFHP31]|nr:hypothetical protein PQX77_017450 [Marasmius sp. AFHP31]
MATISNLFTNAKHFRIGDYATIQNVGGDVTTNVYEQRDFVNLRQEHASKLESKLLKVGKVIDHVAVLGLPGGFTSVTVEPAGSEDQVDDFEIVWCTLNTFSDDLTRCFADSRPCV